MKRTAFMAAFLAASLFESGCSRQVATVFPQNFSSQTVTGTSAYICYAPACNLEQIDSSLIAKAQSTIDMAAYSLTDRAIAAALERRAAKRVQVRIYLDRDQPLRSWSVATASLIRSHALQTLKSG